MLGQRYHREWVELLDRFREVGLAADLTYAEYFVGLGRAAERRPTGMLFAALLHRYYVGDDESADPITTLERRRSDGYAGVSVGEPIDAWRWLARLIGAAPVLGGVSLNLPPLADSWIGDDELGGWISLGDMVDAANSLLRVHSDERFVPLLAHIDGEAYVRLCRARAMVLDRLGLLEEGWLEAFEVDALLSAA